MEFVFLFPTFTSMFFILSKILAIVLVPLYWIIGLLVVGLWRKHTRVGRRMLRIGVTLLLLTTNPLLYNLVLDAYEPEPPRELTETYDYIILLGGFTDATQIDQPEQYYDNGQGDRLLTALQLYRTGSGRKILISSGSNHIIRKEFVEADHVARYLRSLGIPESDILIENQSRNTYENAQLTAAMLPEDARCLLVTSAFHMPRAAACFRRVGIDFTAYPTNPMSKPLQWSLDHWLSPNPMGLYYWKLLIKEWVGYVVYKLKGVV